MGPGMRVGGEGEGRGRRRQAAPLTGVRRRTGREERRGGGSKRVGQDGRDSRRGTCFAPRFPTVAS